MTAGNTLLLCTQDDVKYLPAMKPLMQHEGSTFVCNEIMSTVSELKIYCARKAVTKVFCTQEKLIPRLTGSYVTGAKEGTLSDYAGSYFQQGDLEIVFLNPLAQLFTVPYGKFLASRFISKLHAPHKWFPSIEFSWKLFSPALTAQVEALSASSDLIAVDIETIKDPLAMTMVGFCFYSFAKPLESLTVVVPLNLSNPDECEYNLQIIKKLCASKPAKILQNGKYDAAYLSRFGTVLYNYIWDTATANHCYYSELPKTLDALAAFYIREGRYWKNLSNGDAEQQYLYNAKDCWNTLCVFLAWVWEAPQYALTNYEMEFPLIMPCHLNELQGMLVDQARFKRVKQEKEAEAEQLLTSIRTQIASPGYNPKSPTQTKKLLAVLGCEDIKSTEEKDLKKAANRHSLNSRIINAIIDYRKARKLVESYLQEDAIFNGMMLYSINPHGTDTGRMACTKHHFWCGVNFQTMPREGTVKSAYMADPDFLLGEADYAQAESRGTGYITGEQALISAVESGRDFHSINASAFFGLPYEEIYDDAAGKAINKGIRDLSKRTNHGANYNIGWAVLIDTMGEQNVLKAKHLLGLPKYWTLKQVAEYLLDAFDKTYPKVRNDYQKCVIYEVETNRKLVGATGWTRYCFGTPSKNKLQLNSYVAHCPQSLNAMILNKAYMKVFYNVWRRNKENFKLCAQIHDSILFQYRIGHEYLAQQVKEEMEFYTDVTDIDGVTRQMLVPVDLNIGMTHWNKG